MKMFVQQVRRICSPLFIKHKHVWREIAPIGCKLKPNIFTQHVENSKTAYGRNFTPNMFKKASLLM
jgi:hypothetical protein